MGTRPGVGTDSTSEGRGRDNVARIAPEEGAEFGNGMLVEAAVGSTGEAWGRREEGMPGGRERRTSASGDAGPDGIGGGRWESPWSGSAEDTAGRRRTARSGEIDGVVDGSWRRRTTPRVEKSTKTNRR